MINAPLNLPKLAFGMFSPLVAICLLVFLIGSAQAQLTESANASPFEVQGNDASIAQSGDQFSPARLQEYERQLNAVLKTRRVEERQFISSLVDQIEIGGVSTELVQTSFKWVRRKRPNTTFPFLYFERVLRIIATQQGVGEAIPPFNTSVIGQPNPPNQDTSGTATNEAAGIVTQ